MFVSKRFEAAIQELDIGLEHIRGNRFATQCWPAITIAKPSFDDPGVRAAFASPSHTNVFCKSDYGTRLMSEIARHPHKTFTVVLHNSDHSFTQGMYDRAPKNILKWYVRNCQVDRPNVVPIPIGLENEGEGRAGDLFALHYARTRMPKNNESISVYVNFNTATNVTARKAALDAIAGQRFAEFHSPHLSFSQHIARLRYNTFCVSPPGNGEDCHRTWEALYVGTIPIVLSSTMTYSFKELPIMIVNSWEEVTQGSLEAFLNSLEDKRRVLSLEKLKMSYWLNRIRMGE